MQHASTTLTRHTHVFAGWSDGAALGGPKGAWRRGGGAAEGCLQHRHSGKGIAPNLSLSLSLSHTHTHTHMYETLRGAVGLQASQAKLLVYEALIY